MSNNEEHMESDERKFKGRCQISKSNFCFFLNEIDEEEEEEEHIDDNDVEEGDDEDFNQHVEEDDQSDQQQEEDVAEEEEEEEEEEQGGNQQEQEEQEEEEEEEEEEETTTRGRVDRTNPLDEDSDEAGKITIFENKFKTFFSVILAQNLTQEDVFGGDLSDLSDEEEGGGRRRQKHDDEQEVNFNFLVNIYFL